MQPLLAVLVMGLYLSASIFFWQVHRHARPPKHAVFLLCSALLLHAALLYWLVKHHGVLDLSVFKVISLYGWGVALLSLFWFWRSSMALAGVVVCLANAFLVLLPHIFVSEKIFGGELARGMIWHILSSVAAWTTLTISFIHALLYRWLFQRLKHKQLKNIKALSLNGLERGMILISSLGFLFLSISLLTGWLFVDDLFTQHLAHKTILTMLAWLSLAWILLASYTRSIRGMSLVYGLLAMFTLLLMGYVLSNIILQFIVKH
ncbi:MAG: cytochrome c biogenesis protein CcsA [Cardiobacteriaceae bacterium]|nr:cytochrome c biogenesis protein CcsA [Cardiobacteriaceae bacterium]